MSGPVPDPRIRPEAKARVERPARYVAQRKVIVGAAHDEYERNADEVAAAVVRLLETGVTGATPSTSGGGDDDVVTRTFALRTRIQRLASPPVGPDGGPVPPGVERGLEVATRGGQPFDGPARGQMEQAFGADFSSVRIHADATAARLSASLGARAFTTGRHVFFGPGEYAPGARDGRLTLAHELTHVVQQTGGGPRLRRAGPAGTAAPGIATAEHSSSDGGRRIVATDGGATIGSVAVHPRDATAVEMTDLRVAPEQRSRGHGAELVQSAALAGRRMGRRRVALTADDDGSGHLDGWYSRIGFSQVGSDGNGRARFEAPVAGLLSRTPVPTLRRTRIQRMEMPRVPVPTDLTVPAGIRPPGPTDLATQAAFARYLTTEVGPYTTQLGALIRAVASSAKVGTALGNAVIAARDLNPYDPIGAGEALKLYLAAIAIAATRALADARAAVQREMKFGTEFSFTHESLFSLQPTKRDPACFKAAGAFIDDWAGRVKGIPITVGKNTVTCTITREPWEKGHGVGASEQAARFEYSTAGPTEESPPCTFYWVLNIDQGCLETQAQPITIEEASGEQPFGDYGATLNLFRDVMRMHIFEIAPLCGLRTDARIGGGHLSLDRATTFKDDGRCLRNLLVLYANEWQLWSHEDVDAYNAPTIGELNSTGKAAFAKLITDVDVRFRNREAVPVTDIAAAMVRDVYKNSHFSKNITNTADPGGKKRAEQPAHYQSANVEHVDDPETAKQRIEMRRFDAQRSVEDLLSDLYRLRDLIARSMAPGLVPLKPL